ncbi:hypothetical protein B0T24DRAFT_371983 [Lasiosphaeria ovina]|uniref:Uncharacterized protein n=1 Tax=Lasiosphaeria ovina TaxID=92902 RepID=A0AAE0N120_9PEZI|nr:hypothetical protein B0T24DRAFT_371983 [Lasiosphaeria ovina]
MSVVVPRSLPAVSLPAPEGRKEEKNQTDHDSKGSRRNKEKRQTNKLPACRIQGSHGAIGVFACNRMRRLDGNYWEGRRQGLDSSQPLLRRETTPPNQEPIHCLSRLHWTTSTVWIQDSSGPLPDMQGRRGGGGGSLDRVGEIPRCGSGPIEHFYFAIGRDVHDGRRLPATPFPLSVCQYKPNEPSFCPGLSPPKVRIDSCTRQDKYMQTTVLCISTQGNDLWIVENGKEDMRERHTGTHVAVCTLFGLAHNLRL